MSRPFSVWFSAVLPVSLVACAPGAGSVVDAKSEVVQSGDLVITEVMANPAACSDADGEWIEVYNASDREVPLEGLRVSTTTMSGVTVSDRVLRPGGLGLIGRSADGSGSESGWCDGAPVVPDAFVETFSVANSRAHTLVLADAHTGEVYDVVSIPRPVSGVAWQLQGDVADAWTNDDAAAWCAATDGDDDLGTPLAVNGDCGFELPTPPAEERPQEPIRARCDVHIPSDYATLQEALSVGSGSTICLADGYVETGAAPGMGTRLRDASIVGLGVEPAVLSGFRRTYLENVTIQNVRFTGAVELVAPYIDDDSKPVPELLLRDVVFEGPAALVLATASTSQAAVHLDRVRAHDRVTVVGDAYTYSRPVSVRVESCAFTGGGLEILDIKEADSVVVVNNTFQANEVGLSMAGESSYTDNARHANNLFVDNVLGIQVTGTRVEGLHGANAFQGNTTNRQGAAPGAGDMTSGLMLDTSVFPAVPLAGSPLIGASIVDFKYIDEVPSTDVWRYYRADKPTIGAVEGQ